MKLSNVIVSEAEYTRVVIMLLSLDCRNDLYLHGP